MLKGKKKKKSKTCFSSVHSEHSKATAGAVTPAWGAEHRWHHYGEVCGEHKVAPTPLQSFSPVLGGLGGRQEPPALGSSHCICNTSEKQLADVTTGWSTGQHRGTASFGEGASAPPWEWLVEADSRSLKSNGA